jgi:hypothetical protein
LLWVDIVVLFSLIGHNMLYWFCYRFGVLDKRKRVLGDKHHSTLVVISWRSLALPIVNRGWQFKPRN